MAWAALLFKRGEFHEIGSWRVTAFPKGLARVIETDSPRSRTLVVSTFPTPLSRTGRAGFLASGSPEKTFHSLRIRKDLRISRPANSIQFGKVSPTALGPVRRFPALLGRS